jgi:hypothetical protein
MRAWVNRTGQQQNPDTRLPGIPAGMPPAAAAPSAPPAAPPIAPIMPDMLSCSCAVRPWNEGSLAICSAICLMDGSCKG